MINYLVPEQKLRGLKSEPDVEIVENSSLRSSTSYPVHHEFISHESL